jgi:Tol biopolymer transport system component
MGPGTFAVRGVARLTLVATLACLAGASAAHATFPGRPGHIAFSAETGSFDNQNAVLWDLDPRTEVRRQLTRRPRACTRDSAWVDGGPEYSPDGRWIAYLHWDNCRPEVRYALRVMRADGSRNRVLKGLGVADPL